MKLIAALAVAALFLAAPQARCEALFEPADGKAIFFVGQDTDTIEEYIRSLKLIPAGFMVYTSIQEADGLWNESPDYGAGTGYAERLLRKYPGTTLQIGLYMVGGLKETVEGNYDTNLAKMAKWFKKIKSPVFLRIGYEFDGPHNGYNKKDYVEAYIHVVDYLRAAGVQNVAYVWHSYAGPYKGNLSDWYPGDGYVDWIGISYFSGPKGYKDAVVAFAAEREKPVMIAEATPQGIGTSHGKISWNRWFRDFFKYIEANNIKAVSYINSNWEDQRMWQGQNWQDARVQADPEVKKMFLEEISKARYLQSSKELFNMLKFIPEAK